MPRPCGTGVQSNHFSVMSHDDQLQQNSICKKGGVSIDIVENICLLIVSWNDL